MSKAITCSVFFFCYFSYVKSVGWDTKTPLDDYVARPDSHYKWEQLNEYPMEGCTIYVLNMTSQKWLTDQISSQPIWWHYLSVSIPTNFRYLDAGVVFIGGGSNRNSPPTPDDDIGLNASCQFAADAGVATGYLKQIPNQPIVFTDDPDQWERTEDSIIAWTWRKFIINPNDTDILLRLPMTKATVRAMDTVSELSRQKVPESNVSRFMIAGSSKRGWTTWTTGAVDKRVIAMAPIVLTALNFVKTIHHYYRALCGWSFALSSYWVENLTQYMDHPNTQKIMDIVDAYSYKERLTMPKLVIHATGDEFFQPDDPHYFFDALPEPKHLLLLDNTNHGVTFSELRIYEAALGFYKTILAGLELPKLSWQRNETATGGSMTMMSNVAPSSVKAWSADTVNNTRRDFRWFTVDEVNPVVWDSKDVNDLGNNVYQVEYNKTSIAWRGFFIQAKFSAPDNTELDFTTEINVIPDNFPCKDCQGFGCWGDLV